MTETDQILLNVKSLKFPTGLEGFPEWKMFDLQQTAESMPIALLQSQDEPKASFIVANPYTWFPNFKIEITSEDMAALKVKKVEELSVLAIINVVAVPFEVTANLLAPLFINTAAKIGLQKIMHGSGYQARQPLTLKTLKVTLPEGLLGLPEYKHFVLQSTDELSPIHLLACQDDTHISFPVVDPTMIDADYAPKLTQDDRDFLGASDLADLQCYVILNVQSTPLQVNANMLAPLVINSKINKGRQVILSKSGYPTNYPMKFVDLSSQLVNNKE